MYNIFCFYIDYLMFPQDKVDASQKAIFAWTHNCDSATFIRKIKSLLFNCSRDKKKKALVAAYSIVGCFFYVWHELQLICEQYNRVHTFIYIEVEGERKKSSWQRNY